MGVLSGAPIVATPHRLYPPVRRRLGMSGSNRSGAVLLLNTSRLQDHYMWVKLLSKSSMSDLSASSRDWIEVRVPTWSAFAALSALR